MRRKDLYTNKIKPINELIDYLNPIIRVDRQSQKETLIVELDKLKIKDKHVWVLYGKNDEAWDCLQVATSKDIIGEIKSDIDYMYQNECPKLTDDNNKYVNTQFYLEVYKSGGNKIEYIYSKMKADYDELVFYYLDVDKYLDIRKIQSNNQDLINIVDIAKYWYAEAMFAYETQAIYWNAYRGGADMKALLLIKEQDNK